MILKKDIFNLKTRRIIYEYILKNPGLHLREISRNIDVSFSSIRHHLNFLEKQGLITSNIDKRYKRFYVKKTVGKKEKEILNLLRQETPRRIIMLFLTPGPGKIFIDKETQKRELSKASAYKKIYSKNELINLTKYWTGPYGKYFHLKKHPSTVGFHIKKLLELGLIEKVNIGKRYKFKLKDEDMLWSLLIKYKDNLSIKAIDLYLSWQDEALEEAGENILDNLYDVFPNPYHI